MSVFVAEIGSIIAEAYKVDPKQNLGFLGPVGAGKTDSVYQIGEELRADYPQFFVKAIILSQRSAEDFTIPWPTSGEANRGSYSHLTHDDWIFPEDARGIILLDEALNASPDVIKSVQNILSSRELNGKKLPDGIMLVLLSNRKEDRAGVNSFNTAFGNRVEWHQVEIDFDGWEKWALQHKIHATIVGFLKKFKQHLYDFKNDRLVNATPRTWAKANLVLGSKFEYERLAGLLGDGIATEFTAFRKLFGDFPEVSEIRANPAKAKLPQGKDAQFALATALAMWTTRENWSAFVQYTERMDKEYKFMYMREAARIHRDIGLKTTKEWSSYIIENQKDLI